MNTPPPTPAAPATKKKRIQFGRYGLKSDPRGAHVTLQYEGRTLLGEVQSAFRCEARGMAILVVRHFNGEQWPIRPAASAVMEIG